MTRHDVWYWLALTAWGTIVALSVLEWVHTLWPRLRCLTGHHRETVIDTPVHGGFIAYHCVDCDKRSPLYHGVVFTPSRRYALRKRQRAA